MTTPKLVNVKLRLDENLYEALRALAKAGERTVAGEMRLALRAHVNASEPLPEAEEAVA